MDFYADSNNGDDTYNGTQKSPLRSLQALQDRLSPGDTGYLEENSVWAGGWFVGKSGEVGKPIKYAPFSYSGSVTRRPVISHSQPAVAWSRAIDLAANWIIFEGLRINNANEAGILASGSNHNHFIDMEFDAVGTGILFIGSNDNLVKDSHFHDLNMVYIGGGWDHGAVGIELRHGSKRNEIAFSLFNNCKAPSPAFGVDGGMMEFYGDAVSFNTIHHNVATNCAGVYECAGVESENHRQVGNSFLYNLFVDNGLVGGIHMGTIYGLTVKGLLIESNTIYEPNAAEDLFLFWGGQANKGQVIVRNNITQWAGSLLANSDGWEHYNNLWHRLDGGPIGVTLGNNEIIADPQFKDHVDFMLTSHSPAINAGIVTENTQDAIGAPDLGYREYEPQNGGANLTAIITDLTDAKTALQAKQVALLVEAEGLTSTIDELQQAIDELVIINNAP